MNTKDPQKVAHLLNDLDYQQREQLLEQMARLHPDLAEAIRDALFTFSDLVYVEDKGLQSFLRDLDQRTLAKTLKHADVAVIDKILGNLSKRARIMLLEEQEALGQVRLSEVRSLQKDLARQVRRLSEEGKLIIIRPEDDDPLIP